MNALDDQVTAFIEWRICTRDHAAAGAERGVERASFEQAGREKTPCATEGRRRGPDDLDPPVRQDRDGFGENLLLSSPVVDWIRPLPAAAEAWVRFTRSGHRRRRQEGRNHDH